MYSLDVIVSSNARAARKPKAENAFTRHCSFHSGVRGVILHSASKRSTAFIEAGPKANRFLRKIAGYQTQRGRDAVIESHF